MKKKKNKNVSNQKGRIVEEIVSLLHEQPGISVERNVWLPTSDGKDKREIDVLISGTIAGYPVRLAIECKNYGRRIEKTDIDAFIGKLFDLSFPSQYGIFVSTSKYTKGAIKRADHAGIRVLSLNGLTKDRLKEAIYNALQSVVYLLPVIARLAIFNEVPTMTAEDFMKFTDESGQSFILVDLLWQNWCSGKYPKDVGEHEIQVDIPVGFTQTLNGRRLNRPTIALTLHVYAVVVEIPGIAKQLELHNSSTSNIEKINIKLSFETPNGPLPLHIFKTEDSLKTFMESRSEKYKLTVGRIMIPRILTPGLVFWPPSQKWVDNLNNLIREKGNDFNSEKIDLSSLQGNDLLGAAYDAIWQGHPAARQKSDHSATDKNNTGVT
ncbi:restriction endonuclease [Candidatus Manganitrophus noduliformans]|uniref:Restriction endonuclease n=1 Tax=Candidatus Manganitrophus noduliformans TaxID=2606439 RepID=A0A7X6IAM3_9BACT|nr:restriction endonuclease [Candidatus Manganitrophus noduliformans]NKE70626.1 restriction endonuclease [Candidatus Manganitrophus noduliformans]